MAPSLLLLSFMHKQLAQVLEWHKAFNVPYKTRPDYLFDRPLYDLRYRIMQEEMNEWFVAASTNANVSARAKELADLLYTVYGTIITEGLQDHIEDVFDEVHRSNMSKLGDDGLPIMRSDGKVLKGPNYKEPDLSFIK